MKTKRHIGWVGAAAMVALGCSSGGSDPPSQPVTSQSTLLRKAGSCDELGAMLRADAEKKIDARVDAALRLLDDPSLSLPGNVGVAGSSGAGGGAGAGAAGGAGAGAGATGGSAGSGASASGGSDAGGTGMGAGGSNSGNLSGGTTGGGGTPSGSGGAGTVPGGTGTGGTAEAGGSSTTGPATGGGATGGSSSPGSAGSGNADNAAGQSGAGKAAGGQGGAPSHSDTTTQVEGVDEADIIKTDGNYLYVLHGRRLVRASAWPASQLAAAGDVVIEGKPLEMFLRGDQVVVFSQVASQALEQAGEAPRGYYEDTYAADLAARASGAQPSPPSGPTAAEVDPADPREQLTKVTVVSLSSGAPQTQQEVYFEGAYASARRVGKAVRVVLNGKMHGPSLPEPKAAGTVAEQRASLEQTRLTSKQLLGTTSTDQWLPSTMTRKNGSTAIGKASCEEFYVPEEGSTELGLVRVETLDLETGEVAGASVVGKADAVYGDQDSIFIAARGYVDPVAVRGGLPVPSLKLGGLGAGADPSKVKKGAVQGADPSATPLDITYIHQFDFDKDGGAPAHVASGGLVGTVKNQFSIDRRDGVLRVVTTEKRQPGSTGKQPAPSELASHAFTFSPDPDGTLSLRGDAGALARGESVSSTRFVGSYGFVETTAAGAPLMVVDLSDPTRPAPIATVAIPGFGEFMQPLDGSHLLTIGRSGDAADPGALALRIVDVSDVTHPVIKVPELAFDSSQYGFSAAETDQKALAYFAERGLLAIPYVGRKGDDIRSSLEVFRVNVVTGITKVASIDHSALFAAEPAGYCEGLFPHGVRRGLFIEDFVYSISYAGIVVNDVKLLDKGETKPAATLQLPPPEAPDGVSCPSAPFAPPAGSGSATAPVGAGDSGGGAAGGGSGG